MIRRRTWLAGVAVIDRREGACHSSYTAIGLLELHNTGIAVIWIHDLCIIGVMFFCFVTQELQICDKLCVSDLYMNNYILLLKGLTVKAPAYSRAHFMCRRWWLASLKKIWNWALLTVTYMLCDVSPACDWIIDTNLKTVSYSRFPCRFNLCIE